MTSKRCQVYLIDVLAVIFFRPGTKKKLPQRNFARVMTSSERLLTLAVHSLVSLFIRSVTRIRRISNPHVLVSPCVTMRSRREQRTLLERGAPFLLRKHIPFGRRRSRGESLLVVVVVVIRVEGNPKNGYIYKLFSSGSML